MATTTRDISYGGLKAVWLEASKGTKYHTNQWASLMAAIAEAESGGDPLATNPTDNNGTQTSWGLFQISNGTHSEPSRAWSDPVTNARLAIGKLDTQGLSAWGTYDSGAYKAFISDKTAADPSGVPGGPSAVETSAATSAASTTADCLFPPGGGLTIPVIPGVYHQSIHFCLLSKSEARAVAAVAFLAAGFVTTGIGLALLLKVLGALAAMERAGGGMAEAGGLIASVAGAPEFGVPLAAGGAAVKKSGTVGAAKASAGRRVRNRQQQEKRDTRDYDRTMSRKRDSAAGPAVRDQGAAGESGRDRARRYAGTRTTDKAPF
jgi:Lysozyme like domain